MWQLSNLLVSLFLLDKSRYGSFLFPPPKSRHAFLHAISWTIFFLLQAACQSWHQSHPHENIRLTVYTRRSNWNWGVGVYLLQSLAWNLMDCTKTEGGRNSLQTYSRFLICDFKRSFGLFCYVSSSRSCYVLLRFRLLLKVIPSWIHFGLQTSDCFRLQTYRVDFRLKIWDLWYQREELIQQHARIESENRNHQRMKSEVWSLKSFLGFRMIDIIFLSVKYCFW